MASTTIGNMRSGANASGGRGIATSVVPKPKVDWASE